MNRRGAASHRCRPISKLVIHVILLEIHITPRRFIRRTSFACEMTPAAFNQTLLFIMFLLIPTGSFVIQIYYTYTNILHLSYMYDFYFITASVFSCVFPCSVFCPTFPLKLNLISPSRESTSVDTKVISRVSSCKSPLCDAQYNDSHFV